MSSNHNNNPAIDVRGLCPNSPTKVAHVLSKGFASDGTVIRNKIPSQHVVDNIRSNIPNNDGLTMLLQINGVSEEDCNRLQRFAVTLSGIKEDAPALTLSLKTKLANSISGRIKNTESVGEKTIDDLQKEGMFYFQDLLIVDNAQSPRSDMIRNKLDKRMRGKTREEIGSVIKFCIAFDVRLCPLDLSKKERKQGITTDLFKIMWKILHNEDLGGGDVRSKTNIFMHLSKLYGINKNQQEAMSDENDENYKQFRANFKLLCKYDGNKGSGFVYFGNDKIKQIIEDLSMNGFKVNPPPKTPSTPSSNNKNKKRKYQDMINSDDDTNDNSAKTVIGSIKKRKPEHQISTTNSYSFSSTPRKYSQSYYDSIPTELRNFEGREVWSIEHHTNKIGFWRKDSFFIAIFLGQGASELEIACEVNASVPRCTADIVYVPMDLTREFIEELIPEEVKSNDYGSTIIYTLPKRKNYSVILPIPEVFRHSICSPTCYVKKEKGIVLLRFKAESSKLMHIKSSLNSSLTFKSKNIDNALQNKLTIISFKQYEEQQIILQNIDDAISPRGEWFYYKRLYEQSTNVPSQLTRKKDIVEFWQNEYEKSEQWKQNFVNRTMEREEAAKQNSTHKQETCITFGIDGITFDNLMGEKTINDKRIEIVENDLPVEGWKTINEFKCSLCAVKISNLDWNDMKHFFCNRCIKKEWKKKENVSLYECEEAQLQRDAEVIAKFPKEDGNEEHIDVGSLYVKYASKGKHIVSILFCNAKVPTIYYFNDSEYITALKNTKLLIKY